MAKYLFHYRNVEYSTTGRALSEMLFGRKLRMRLDLYLKTICRPNVNLEIHRVEEKPIFLLMIRFMLEIIAIPIKDARKPNRK